MIPYLLWPINPQDKIKDNWVSNYTPTLGDLVDNNFPLWDFEYDIFDESYRPIIEQLVFDAYAFRQICMLPAERWKHRFKTTWLLNWGYYNERYKTTCWEFNPFLTELLEDSHKRDDEQKTMTQFASILEAAEKLRQAAASRNDIKQNEKSEQLDESLQTDKNTTTEDNDKVTDRDTEFTKDEHTDQDETKNVVGESHQKETYSETLTHSDYPQSNIAATPPENPGQWATWQETKTGNKDTDLTTKEDTTTKLAKDVHTTSDEKMHQTEDENKVKVYTGTIDKNSTSNYDKNTTVDDRVSSTQNQNNDKHSELATAEDRYRTIGIHYKNKAHGFRNISQSELLQQFRATIINVDNEVVNSISHLFMGVF